MATRTLLISLPLLLLGACDDKGDSGATGGTDGASGALDCVDGYCTLPAIINEDLTLTSDLLYVLPGSGVFVGDGSNSVELTIEAGTTIYGEPQSFLAIQRNSTIQAVGTAEAPIVFTSPQAEGSRNRADWGGLILNGNAPINNCSDGTEVPDCTAEGEGSTGTYGGTDPDDSSGTLRYVRVEFGGYEITPENEVNGIAFQGVGAGTDVSYIQVHMNKDDGVEFYGGTVSASHVVVTGAGDDSLDWTDGWTGSVDRLLVVQASDLADRGIEADNNGDQNSAVPTSSPTLTNLTILGAGSESVGALLREGTQADITNLVVQGSGSACLDVDGDATFGHAEAGTLAIRHSVLSCDSYFKVESGEDAEPFDIQAWFEGQTGNATTTNPGLDGWMPQSGSSLIGAGSGGSTIGAFDEGEDWASAWIITDES